MGLFSLRKMGVLWEIIVRNYRGDKDEVRLQRRVDFVRLF
jgi:hypothetical protein